MEATASGYRGFSPTVDPAEAVQRGMIETYLVKGKPLTRSHVLKAACGWKKALAGRKSREFSPIGRNDDSKQVDWIGTTPRDGGRVQGQGEIDLSETIAAEIPVGQYGGEREAVAEMLSCLSEKGRARMTRQIEKAGHGLGSDSAQLLQVEILRVLPIWRERMREVRAEWRIKARPKYAAARRYLERRREIWRESGK